MLEKEKAATTPQQAGEFVGLFCRVTADATKPIASMMTVRAGAK
jgi:hypothetical protein